MLQEILSHAIDVLDREAFDALPEAQDISQTPARDHQASNSPAARCRVVLVIDARRQEALLHVIELALGDALLCDDRKRPIERGFDRLGANAGKSGGFERHLSSITPKLIAS